MNLDFTLQKYTELCQTIRRLNCPVMTIRQFIAAGQPHQLIIVLRHDVDRLPASALQMAELEAAYDLQATYYLRSAPAVFKASTIKQLHQLGHEVGYHYETLTKTRGNSQQAITLFAQDLEAFRQIAPVETISMHGSPLTPWNNLDLWQDYNFEAYNLIGEAYLSIDYSDLYYFTDTGRSWEAGRYNLRDRAHSRQPPQKIRATDDLIQFLAARPDNPILINAHPNRWASSWSGWLVSAASDWLINQVKWALSLLRKSAC